MTRVYGVVTGIVRDVQDPDSQGRVQVAFPWLPGDNDSYWAPVATMMTGGTRGSWFMPERDDEVLVAFDHGNVDQPFVIGYLWNGVQKPPDEGGTSVRRLKTVSGHVIEFHDEDGGHKILIQTAQGQKVSLDDTDGSITVKTAADEEVRLSPGQIEITAAQVTVNADAGVTVNCGSAEVTATADATVAAASASVTAAAELTLAAPSVTVAAAVAEFTGVVMAQTVISEAIVGAAYTPAPGNTFGL